MKRRLLLIVIYISIELTNTYAYDFAQTNRDGAWIYYHIINDSTVTFACDKAYYGDSSLIYIDTLHLPDYVEQDSKTYKVQYKSATGFHAPTRTRPKVIWIPPTCNDIPIPLNMVFVQGDRLHFNGRDSISLNSIISYEIAHNNSRLKSKDGVIYSLDDDTLLLFPSGRCGTFDIPKTVKILGDNSFAFTALDTLNIGDNITDIGADMMVLALNMKSFRYPNTIKRIERRHSVWGYNLDEIIYGSGTKYVFGYLGESKYLSRIVCLATTPPEVGFKSILGSDTLTLFVPRKSIGLYQQANGWKNFYAIRPIEPPVIVGANIVEISWVSNADADSYTLTLYTDEAKTKRFMSLTFDANGHLTRIDINSNSAPERMMPLDDEEEEKRFAEYYSFTITGLSPQTQYFYTRQSLKGTEVIDEETGSFTTDSPSNLHDINTNGLTNKILYDGHLLINHNGHLHTATGARVK